MSNDSEKFQCVKRLFKLIQLVLEEKRDPARIAKIAQSVISERQQEERTLDFNRDAREVIDGLILKVMSGEVVFRLETHIAGGVILSYKKGMTCCNIIYCRQYDKLRTDADHIDAVLSHHDFNSVVSLSFNQQDKEFFLNLWLEMCQAQDRALLVHSKNSLL